MAKFKNSITLVLFISFFLISTCTTDNSITGNYDQSLGKTTGVLEINNPTGHNTEDALSDAIERISQLLNNNTMEIFVKCVALAFTAYGSEFEDHHDDTYYNTLSKSYDFRDNYLSKSYKGEIYTSCYYILSNYGIENNLVNQYYKEHYDLIITSIEIAYELQHGSNSNRIMINWSTRNDLKDLLKVYRSSPNHKEIEPVLEYLEMDLDKYYNKPKYAIAADFEEN